MVHVSDMVAATKQQGSIMNVGRECPLSPAGGDGEVARQRRSRVADSDPSDNSQRAAVLSTGTARTKNSLRLALSNAASSFATIFLAFQFFTNFLAVRVLASDDTSTTEAGTAAVSLPEARYSLNGIAAYVWRLTMMFVFCTAILLGLLWYFQEKLLFLPGGLPPFFHSPQLLSVMHHSLWSVPSFTVFPVALGLLKTTPPA
eukprot:GHVT01005024.1.p1 GENE.GHVT01005024.1~~GHVT01005024.1.p1  ORF type:complete len:202 (-),score=21.10 GHVT01005024.1:1440-2045(-)